jgi:hypothetical protein
MVQTNHLDEFRNLPEFKTVKPYLRKCVINIGKVYPNSIFSISGYGISVRIPDIKDYCVINSHDFCCNTVVQDKVLSDLLYKISQYGYCLAYGKGDLFMLRKFNKVNSQRNPEHVYHRTNVLPNIILNEGIKRNYSLNTVKPHPPLVFVSENPMWFGKYTYKIKVNSRSLFIDTNLDWQCRDIRGIFCLYEDILKEDIVGYETNETFVE